MAYMAPEGDIDLGHSAGSERGGCVVSAKLPNERCSQGGVLLQLRELLWMLKERDDALDQSESGRRKLYHRSLLG